MKSGELFNYVGYSSKAEHRSVKPKARERYPLPTPYARLIQWLECWSYMPNVPGSIPGSSTI